MSISSPEIDRIVSTIHRFLGQGDEVVALIRVADRGKQSLNGAGKYARRFEEITNDMGSVLAGLRTELHASLGGSPLVEAFFVHADILHEPYFSLAERESALSSIKRLVAKQLVPALRTVNLPAMPANDAVISAAVVAGSRAYIERLVRVINGCYEQRWFDGAAVMLRKLIEILIIEVYEHRGDLERITLPTGDPMMLSGLVDQIMGDSRIMLGKDARKLFPLIKESGDRSAHARRYMANRQDIDKLIPNLRVAVEELLHLAGMK